jgi:hypothetical protein
VVAVRNAKENRRVDAVGGLAPLTTLAMAETCPQHRPQNVLA